MEGSAGALQRAERSALAVRMVAIGVWPSVLLLALLSFPNLQERN